MNARRLAVAVLAVIASLGLVGCANRPTTVFSVNGAVTTQSRVAEVAESCATAINTALSTDEYTADYLRPNTTQMLFQGQIGVALSQRLGMTYTEDDLRGFLNQTEGAPAYLEDQVCSDMVLDYATFILLMYDAGGSLTDADFDALEITVNPRYGQFDPAALEFKGSGSLSQEAPGH